MIVSQYERKCFGKEEVEGSGEWMFHLLRNRLNKKKFAVYYTYCIAKTISLTSSEWSEIKWNEAKQAHNNTALAKATEVTRESRKNGIVIIMIINATSLHIFLNNETIKNWPKMKKEKQKSYNFSMGKAIYHLQLFQNRTILWRKTFPIIKIKTCLQLVIKVKKKFRK